jgi:hypothetical protein
LASLRADHRLGVLEHDGETEAGRELLALERQLLIAACGRRARR